MRIQTQIPGSVPTGIPRIWTFNELNDQGFDIIIYIHGDKSIIYNPSYSIPSSNYKEYRPRVLDSMKFLLKMNYAHTFLSGVGVG